MSQTSIIKTSLQVSKGPMEKRNRMHDGTFFPSAREAWKACIKQVNPRRILMPAYIGYTDREGSGIFDPVIELAIAYTLYPVGSSLQADPELIAKFLKEQDDIDIVLLVHYFGWSGGDISAIKKVCDEAGVVLVEDCAHAFHWGQDIGTLGKIGHYSFYSIHKYLPTSSGGILQNNNYEDDRMAEWYKSNMHISVFEALARADTKGISKTRQMNLRKALSLLDEINGIHLLYTDIPYTPQSLPVWVEGDKIREKLYFYLLNRGIPTTALYYRLHDALSVHDFPEAHNLSNHILNLPIHQDMNSDSIEFMCNEIGDFMKELNF